MGYTYEMKKVFGRNVRNTRVALNMTQEALAEQVGMGVPAISKIERGLSFPTEENLNKLLKVLNTHAHFLFRDRKDISIEEIYSNLLKKLELIKDNEVALLAVSDYLSRIC